MKFSTVLVFASVSSALAQAQYNPVTSARTTTVPGTVYGTPTSPCLKATSRVESAVETPIGTPPCDEPSGAVQSSYETTNAYQPTQAVESTKGESYAAQLGSGAGSQFAAPSVMVMIGLVVAGLVC